MTTATAVPSLNREQRNAVRHEAAKELAIRWEELDAFEAFVKVVWSEVEPRRLEWAPYLTTVCRALHLQMLGHPEYQRLLLNLPPGHGKSLLVSVFAPAFEWLWNPGRRKLYFSAGDNVAKRDSRRTRQVIQSSTYQAILKEVTTRYNRKKKKRKRVWTLAYDQNQKTNFETSAKGFRQCLTLRSGVTGQRADDLIVDDPIDVKDIIMGSPEMIMRRCKEANDIIDIALTTRVNDMRDARLTMIMQRLHMDDPAGHAIRSGDYKVVCLPLHYDPDHAQVCENDPRTERGQRLHPNRFPDEEIDRLKTKLGEAQTEAQLEQQPVPASGDRIKREWLRQRYTCEPEDLAMQADEVWASVDAAKKGNVNSDYHAIQVWARKGDKRYLLHRIAGKMNYPDFELALDGVLDQWNHWLAEKGGCLIEDTANGTTYMQIRGASYDGIALVGFSPTRDTPGRDKSKEARAIYLERCAESGAIVLPDQKVARFVVEDVITWWCAFPRGSHDDDVDAASQLLMRWTIEDKPSSGGVFEVFEQAFGGFSGM